MLNLKEVAQDGCLMKPWPREKRPEAVPFLMVAEHARGWNLNLEVCELSKVQKHLGAYSWCLYSRLSLSWLDPLRALGGPVSIASACRLR